MAINQLFIKKPPIELLETIFTLMGINLKDGNKFYYKSIEDNIKEIIEILLHIKSTKLTNSSSVY